MSKTIEDLAIGESGQILDIDEKGNAYWKWPTAEDLERIKIYLEYKMWIGIEDD